MIDIRALARHSCQITRNSRSYKAVVHSLQTLPESRHIPIRRRPRQVECEGSIELYIDEARSKYSPLQIDNSVW